MLERIALPAVFSIYVDPASRGPVTATLLLARHASHDEVGRVLSGRSEIALNAAGRAEAAALAARLAGVRIDRVWSSPRARALETAEAVAGTRGLTVERCDALDEIDFGDWTGRSFAQLAEDADWRRWNEARGSARCPGGESMGEASGRAMRRLAELGRGNDTVLCVSHCDIIRGLAAAVIGLDPDRLLRFDVDPASVTTVQIGEGWSRLVALNERVA